MPNIDLIIKLISTQDVRKWDNATLLLWATEMAKLIEEKIGKEEVLRFGTGSVNYEDPIKYSVKIVK
jgi:hypothetical protein